MKKFRKLGALVLAVVLAVAMCVPALAANSGSDETVGTSDDTGTIKVSGITAIETDDGYTTDGITVTAYPIIEADYIELNGGSTIFSGYVTQYDILASDDADTTEGTSWTADYLKISEDTLCEIRDIVLGDDYEGKSYTLTLAGGIGEDGVVSYTAEVPVGSYLILIHDDNAIIYNVAVVSVYYSTTEDGSENTLVDGTVDIQTNGSIIDGETWVKSEEPNIDKVITNPDPDDTANDAWDSGTAKGSSFSVGDEVDLQITVKNIPEYPEEEWSDVIFTVSDTMENLAFTEDSIQVAISGEEDYLDEDIDYTVSYTTENGIVTGFTIDFVVEGKYTINDYWGKNIIITYKATLTEDADENADPNKNDVVLSYSHDPTDFTDADTKDSHTYQYTFDIDGAALGGYSGNGTSNGGGSDSETWRVITKTGETDYYAKSRDDDTFDEEDEVVNEIALEGAEFTLYTDADCTETYTNDLFNGTVTSDKQGELQIKGLEAGTYYLKETKAPTGYTLNTHVYKIEIKASYNADGTLAQWSITIDNQNTSTFTVYNDASAAGDAGYEEGDEDKSDEQGWDSTGWTAVTDEEGNILYYVQYNVTETEIPNTSIVELPSTGGRGTLVFTIVGVLVMVAAAGALMVVYRKRHAA